MKVEVSEVVKRPVAEVLQWYAHDHVRNHPRWDPDMEPKRSPRFNRGGNCHPETQHTLRYPVEGTMEVVEFEPNRAFGVVIRDRPTETHGRVTFADEDQG